LDGTVDATMWTRPVARKPDVIGVTGW
jgi:hypothetical protein